MRGLIKIRSLFLLSIIFFLITSCDSEKGTNPEMRDTNGKGEIIAEAFPNLSFKRPLNIQHAGDETNRLFVEEQSGVIYVFENDEQTSNKTVFLDISERVADRQNEQSLLGWLFTLNINQMDTSM